MEAPRDVIVPSSPLVRHGDSPPGGTPLFKRDPKSKSVKCNPPPQGTECCLRVLQFPYYLLPFPRTRWVGGGGVKVAVFLLGNPLYGLYRYVPLDRQAMVPAPM